MTQTPRPPVAQRLREMLGRIIQSWIGAFDSAVSFFRHFVWKRIIGLPPPPVPPRLREMLKDCPELIEEVQGGLNRIVDVMVVGASAVTPFERAVWRLEDTVGHFMVQADAAAESAKAEGDSKLSAQAGHRAHLLGCILSDRPWYDRSEQGLWRYFQTYKAAFE